MREKRKKIWIDRFQTQLSVRIAVYFFLYQVALWSLFLIYLRIDSISNVVGPIAPRFGLILTVVAGLTLSLLFIWDAMKETHRIVGPLYRFRKTTQEIMEGSVVNLIKLRDADYLQDLKDEFNSMLRELESRGAITLKTPEPAAEERQLAAV